MWKDALATAVRGKQVTLGILFACIVIGTAILGYVWAQTDDQIDRGSKIGISVAFGSIIGANLIGLIITAASRIFSLQTASVGYRYPASLRYLLYALSITLAAFSAVLVSSSNITDKSLQTGLVVTTGLLAVFTGFLGLYFHSSLLPIDFEALDDYSQKEGLPQFFPRSLLASENFSSAVTSSDFPEEVQDILLRAAQKKDYLGVLDTLQRLPFSEIKTFKELIEAPELPYAPAKNLAQVIAQRADAKEAAGPSYTERFTNLFKRRPSDPMAAQVAEAAAEMPDRPRRPSFSEKLSNLFKRRPSDPMVQFSAGPAEAPKMNLEDIPAPKVRRPSFSEQVSNIASSARKTFGETKRRLSGTDLDSVVRNAEAIARDTQPKVRRPSFSEQVSNLASSARKTLGETKSKVSSNIVETIGNVGETLESAKRRLSGKPDAVVRNAQALARDTIPSKRPLPPTLLPGAELPASSLLKPRLPFATG